MKFTIEYNKKQKLILQWVQDEIIDFLSDNANNLREMSLRMAIKIADLRKSFPLKWKAMAQVTCMRAI
jgi:hypothetical protein